MSSVKGSNQPGSNQPGSKAQRGVAYDRDYFVDTLNAIMQQMEFDVAVSFPISETFGSGMPVDMYTTASIESGGLIKYVTTDPSTRTPILYLLFPNDLPGAYVSSSSIPVQLIDISLAKIRQYLQDRNSFQYMHAKLMAAFKGSEPAVGQRLTALLEGRKGASAMIHRPSEFDLRFFTTMTSLLLREFGAVHNQKVVYADICRASYIIGHLTVYFRGIAKAELDFELVIKNIERSLGRRPYIYTMEDIVALRSETGVPYTKHIPRTSIEKFIATRSQPEPDRPEPDIIQFRGLDQQQYYIARKSIPTFLISECNRSATEIENALVDEWHRCIECYEQPSCMNDEHDFQKEVIRMLREQHPCFEPLLDYRLLISLAEDVIIPANDRAQIRRFLDPYRSSVRPLAEIVQLNRKQVASRALLLSPFWKRFGPLKFIHRLARALANWLTRRAAARSAPAARKPTYIIPSAEARPASETTDNLQEMAHSLTGGVDDIEGYMASLVDRWNTLLEAQARRKLERDLNILIRDYIHRILQSYRNMRNINIHTISEWGEVLAQSGILAAIPDKRSLRTYIELNIIQQLRRRTASGGHSR